MILEFGKKQFRAMWFEPDARGVELVAFTLNDRNQLLRSDKAIPIELFGRPDDALPIDGHRGTITLRNTTAKPITVRVFRMSWAGAGFETSVCIAPTVDEAAK